MRCRTARQLIALEPDGQLGPGQQRSLQEHLRRCDSCRALRSRMLHIMPALTPDAPEAFDELRPGFYPALQDALAAVNAERNRPPIGVAERLFLRTLDNLPTPLRSVSYALLAAIVLLAGILSTSRLAIPPSHVALDFNANHLASFSLRTTPDGRVYASLVSRSAPARAIGRERFQ